MPTLASELIADFLAIYPDASSGSNVRELRYLNKAHRMILREVCLKADTEDVTLVAGTHEYSLGETVLAVWSARYVRSATAGDLKALDPANWASLESEEPNWRTLPTAEPSRYYVHGDKLGLVAAPSTATSSGYPKVTLEVSRGETLATGSSMPTAAASYEAWISQMCALHARAFDPARHAYWIEVYRMELDQLDARYLSRAALSRPRLQSDRASGRPSKI